MNSEEIEATISLLVILTCLWIIFEKQFSNIEKVIDHEVSNVLFITFN